MSPISKAHRLSVARAWDGRPDQLDDFVRDWAETGRCDMKLHHALERLAQLVADAETRVLLVACNWMHKRGHKSAATDLDYNWNDTDQPGDGSCLPLHVAHRRDSQAASRRARALPR